MGMPTTPNRHRSPSPSSPSSATTVVTPSAAAFPELVETTGSAARRPDPLLASDAR